MKKAKKTVFETWAEKEFDSIVGTAVRLAAIADPDTDEGRKALRLAKVLVKTQKAIKADLAEIDRQEGQS